MAKRQRYVYPTDRIAHLWAHQTQDSARNKCGNFYFTGDTIYSYGGHFPIARHVKHKGKRAVFLTTRTYSVTTSGHKNLVSYALRNNVRCFYVDDVTLSPVEQRGQFLRDVTAA